MKRMVLRFLLFLYHLGFMAKVLTEFSCFPQVLLHVLYEHAAGYALFAVKEVEEIGMLLPQVGPLHATTHKPNLLSTCLSDNFVSLYVF